VTRVPGAGGARLCRAAPGTAREEGPTHCGQEDQFQVCPFEKMSGAATSSSPWEGVWEGNEDVATPIEREAQLSTNLSSPKLPCD
jgi:hypothetical protein